jgi:hypothetical protein
MVSLSQHSNHALIQTFSIELFICITIGLAIIDGLQANFVAAITVGGASAKAASLATVPAVALPLCVAGDGLTLAYTISR